MKSTSTHRFIYQNTNAQDIQNSMFKSCGMFQFTFIIANLSEQKISSLVVFSCYEFLLAFVLNMSNPLIVAL